MKKNYNHIQFNERELTAALEFQKNVRNEPTILDYQDNRYNISIKRTPRGIREWVYSKDEGIYSFNEWHKLCDVPKRVNRYASYVPDVMKAFVKDIHRRAC